MIHFSYEIYVAWLIMGLANSYLAKKTGRNPRLWFLLGVLFGIFGLFFLFFTSKKQAQKAPQQENLPDKKFSPFDADKLWYYVEAGGDSPSGPMSGLALERLLSEGVISLQSYVWTEGMENWERVKSVLKKS